MAPMMVAPTPLIIFRRTRRTASAASHLLSQPAARAFCSKLMLQLASHFPCDTVICNSFLSSLDLDRVIIMGKHLSGLQKEVLALYRVVIREALKKDILQLSGDSPSLPRLYEFWKDPSTSSSFAKEEFRKQVSTVKRSDFRTIEYKLRHGYKQVKLLKMPGVKLVGGR